MGLHHHHHTAPDSAFLANKKGLRVIKFSLLGLSITAILQAVVVFYSGSAALLADTLHNLADAITTIPLWIAFVLAQKTPDRQYTYGYSRFEDLAGAFIVVFIFGSSFLIGYESFIKMKQGFIPTNLPWVIAASIVGYLGNELVARYRIKVGKEINSMAIIADGNHARADALTSLGVLVGVIGVYLGFPLADPLIGFLIAIAILKIGWDTGKNLFTRLADAVPPDLVENITKVGGSIDGVLAVYDVRARYVGHHLRMDITIEVDGKLSVLQGHEIAINVQHALKHEFPLMERPMIHVDPQGHAGEAHHDAPHHQTQ